MKAWTDWEIVRHQVAIGGCVLDADNKPIARAQVTITAMPEEFSLRVEGATRAAGTNWEDLDEHLDRTLSRQQIWEYNCLPGRTFDGHSNPVLKLSARGRDCCLDNVTATSLNLPEKEGIRRWQEPPI